MTQATDPTTGKPVPAVAEFMIEYDACMSCGLCAEVCPFDAIKMDHEFELATSDHPSMTVDKAGLDRPISYYQALAPTLLGRGQGQRAQEAPGQHEAPLGQYRHRAAAMIGKAQKAAPAAAKPALRRQPRRRQPQNQPRRWPLSARTCPRRSWRVWRRSARRTPARAAAAARGRAVDEPVDAGRRRWRRGSGAGSCRAGSGPRRAAACRSAPIISWAACRRTRRWPRIRSSG